VDWSNEHYVRIYTRDTTTWKLLGWDGQAVLMQVLRRLDQSGVMDIEDLQPWEAVVIHCGAPEAIARAGMAVCLARGVLVHNGTYLVAPKFREAQESTKSDKQRQKESRDRRSSHALLPPEPDVTKRDCLESQDVTPPSRDVSETSQPVTVGHNLSLCAVQCSSSAVPNQYRATHVREGGGSEIFDSKTLVSLFSELRVKRGGGSYKLQRTDYDRAQSAVEWATEQNSKDPLAACRSSMQKFFEHAGGKEGDGWPFWGWANDPGKWFAYKPTGEAASSNAARSSLEALKHQLQSVSAKLRKCRDDDEESYTLTIQHGELLTRIARLQAAS
jgi:hypothetical protein